MAVQGSLKTVKIPELFSLLYQLRKTGVLSVVSEEEERGFVFCQGNLVYATTKDNSRRLGSFLVRLGIVTPDKLNKEAERAKGGESYFGQSIIETGRISREQLNAAVREQILDIVEEVLAWNTGAFHLDDNELPFHMPDGVRLSTSSIIIEAAKRADDRAYVRGLFPDLNVVLARNDSISLHVDPAATAIIGNVDGRHTIEQILFASPMGAQATASLLHEWVSKGALHQAGIQVHPGWERPVPDVNCLPVAPAVPGMLFSIFNQETPDLPAACEVLSQDPILVTKVLKYLTLKNVELPRPCIAISRLVDILGTSQLKSILIPEAVRALFFQRPRYLETEFWEHSLICAQLCHRLAEWIDYPFPDEAYTTGLLHNLGAYILMNKDPEKYRDVIQQAMGEKLDLEEIEEKTFGISHTRLGGTYAEKWKFPKVLVLGIKNHHKVEANSAHPLLNILSVANGIALEAGICMEYLPSATRQFHRSLKKLRVSRKKALSLIDRMPRAVAFQQ